MVAAATVRQRQFDGKKMVGPAVVAQLLEHSTTEREVVGSNPAVAKSREKKLGKKLETTC